MRDLKILSRRSWQTRPEDGWRSDVALIHLGQLAPLVMTALSVVSVSS